MTFTSKRLHPKASSSQLDKHPLIFVIFHAKAVHAEKSNASEIIALVTKTTKDVLLWSVTAQIVRTTKGKK